MCTEEGRLRTIGVALSFKVTLSAMWILCVDLAKKGNKKPAERRAKLLILLVWAWVELNYRPHAYQARLE